MSAPIGFCQASNQSEPRFVAEFGRFVAAGFTFGTPVLNSLSFVVISCEPWRGRCGPLHLFFGQNEVAACQA